MPQSHLTDDNTQITPIPTRCKDEDAQPRNIDALPSEVEDKVEALTWYDLVIQEMKIPNEDEQPENIDATPENVDVPIAEEGLNLATIRDELLNQKEDIMKLGSMMTKLAENCPRNTPRILPRQFRQ